VKICIISSAVLFLCSQFQSLPQKPTISIEEEGQGRGRVDHSVLLELESVTKREQCRESCRATFSKSGYAFSRDYTNTNISTSTSTSSSAPSSKPTATNSDSLSFSAVSAMLNIHDHDGDDQGQDNDYVQDGNSYHSSTKQNSHAMSMSIDDAASSTAAGLLLHGGASVGAGVGFGFGDDFILRNISKRPQRLPPLIEELVGTIDGDFISGSTSSSRLDQRVGQRGNLLRRVEKDGYEHDNDNDRDRLGEITKRGLRDLAPGEEDSVAMVAAAAAAAVWSEAGAKKESLRMGKVNEEWEEALRWISSWGQNLQSTSVGASGTKTTGDRSRHAHAHAQTYTQTHHDINNNDMQSGGAGGKQRRKRDSSDRQRLPSERFSAENEIDFERFLDVCIDRCIGDDRDDRAKALHEGDFHKVANYLDFRNTVGFNQILSSIRSIAQKVQSTRGVIQSRTYDQTLRSIFGFILSTTILWLARNINDWRKINKYTNSLRSLLEEERREAVHSNGTAGNNAKCRNAATKKSGSKKSRRKRRDANRNCKKDRQSETKLSIGGDNESVASEEDSFERRYVHVEEEEECHRKNSEDQASKEGNTTISSCTTDGVTDRSDFEYQLMSTDDTIMKLKATNQNTWKANNQSSPRKELDAQAAMSPQGKDIHSTQKVQRSPITINGKYFSKPQSKAPYQQYIGVSGDNNIPLVPTAEQREEAARKLREFQQAQIQKIINSKQRQMAHAKKETASPTTKQILLRDVAQMNNPQTDGEPNNYKLNVIPPPPGLARVAVVGDEGYNHEADPGYLLSKLLEGDDDDEEHSSYNNASKETSPERYLPNRHDTTRSIALGDLLAGTYSGTSTCNFNSLSSNPWKDESVGGSTAETYIASPAHSANRNTTSLLSTGNDMQCSTDANICLQVSAVAFSPSMKSDPTPIGDERIW